MSRRNSTWRRERDHDAFFHEARRRGLRSRAALKLEAIDARDRLFRGTRVVVDLGAAPGGWSQIARLSLAPGGRVVSIDVLEMEPLDGVEFIRGDFLLPKVLSRIEARRGPADRRPCNVGHGAQSDRHAGARSGALARTGRVCRRVRAFARSNQAETFLVKLFQGEETEPYLRMLRERYANVAVRKPAGSRRQSTESYAVARCPGQRSDECGPGRRRPAFRPAEVAE